MTGPARHEPLDPAERELADALARLPGPQGPSPALDAAILGAARTAAAAPAAAGARTPARRRRHRSPAWLRGGALAATLVIAVGVAWQLRPTFDTADLAVEAQVAAQPGREGTPGTSGGDTARATAPAGEASAPVERQRAPATRAAAPEPAQAAPAPASDAPAAAAAPAARARRDVQVVAEPPVVFDDPAPMDAPAPGILDMPAPPPAPPAPPAPPPAPAPKADRPVPTAPAPATRSAVPAADAARARAGGEDWLDQPLDDTPPASVDSPEVREAWLGRIRELVSAERYTEARESFVEFRRRHPDAPVPSDLRMLLGSE